MRAAGASAWLVVIGGLVIVGGIAVMGGWYASRPADQVDVEPQQAAVPAPDSSQSAPAVTPDPAPASGPVEAAAPANADAAPKVEDTAAAPVEAKEPAAEPQEEMAEAEPEEATPEATAPKVEPRLDEIRLEEDGLAVIAGRASPNAEIILRADGVEVARAATDGTGSFATIAMLEPSALARVLTMVEVSADGTETLSPDELILAPMVSAATEPEPVGQPTEAVAAQTSENTPTATEPQVVDVASATQATEAPQTSAPAAEAPAEAAQVASAGSEESAAEPDQTASATETEPAVNAQENDPQTVAAEPPETDKTDVATAEVATGPAEAEPKTTTTEPEVASLPEPAPSTVSEPAAAGAEAEQLAALETGPPAAPRTAEPVAGTAQGVVEPTAPERQAAPRVAILRSNEEGVEVVRPATPAPALTGQVALDSISYSDVGVVELTGRARTGARAVRVYLDNKAIAALEVDEEGGWRGELPEVDTGVYTLRLDEVDESGKVTSRVETPFKREDPEVLAAATPQGTAPVQAVTVQKGDTLWAIARDRYGEGLLYVRVFETNQDKIRDPDLIYPGQVFALPGD